ncbi:reverse transcriptase domain-containing protein [Tanacetum coccineum]
MLNTPISTFRQIMNEGLIQVLGLSVAMIAVVGWCLGPRITVIVVMTTTTHIVQGAGRVWDFYQNYRDFCTSILERSCELIATATIRIKSKGKEATWRGDPVWAVSSERVDSLIGYSLNFFFVLRLLNSVIASIIRLLAGIRVDPLVPYLVLSGIRVDHYETILAVEKRVLIVPPELAYGSKGMQEIPPHSTIQDEMLRLQGLGSNTPTGVPYTEDEIMAIVRGGKQRGHIPGVGRVLPGQGTVIPPPSQSTHSADIARLKKREKRLTKQVNMFMRLFRSDDKFSQMLNQFESQPEYGGGSGSGGCGDDEPGDDEDGGEDEDDS